MRRVLVDTGAIYAFVVRNDVHHEAALEFVAECVSEGRLFVLIDLVFAETMTLLKARLGAEVAVAVGRELRASPFYSWRPLSVTEERDVWSIFQKYEDKEWSYTDCALLATAHRERIAHVFAFDRHFDQMTQLRRMPRGSGSDV